MPAFNCPHCNRALEVPVDLFGQTIRCPSCNGETPWAAITTSKNEPLVTASLAPTPSRPNKESSALSDVSLGFRMTMVAFVRAIAICAIVIVFFLGVVVLWPNFAPHAIPESHRQAAKESVNDISRMVAEDAIEQYYIAKRGSSQMDVYTQASLVAEAYLQANDDQNYYKWKEIARQEGIKAGLPREMLK